MRDNMALSRSSRPTGILNLGGRFWQTGYSPPPDLNYSFFTLFYSSVDILLESQAGCQSSQQLSSNGSGGSLPWGELAFSDSCAYGWSQTTLQIQLRCYASMVCRSLLPLLSLSLSHSLSLSLFLRSYFIKYQSQDRRRRRRRRRRRSRRRRRGDSVG